MSEEDFGDMRRKYWTNREKDDPEDDRLALKLARSPFRDDQLMGLTPNGEKVAVKAITTISVWVEGIYWYKDRTPPASKHTRVRAFFDTEGKLYCPKCECLLCEDFTEYVEQPPIDFSKTMNNPRFICPHCNSLVMVSSKTEVYQMKDKPKKSQ